MNEKFDPIWQAFKNDNLEIVDLSNAGKCLFYIIYQSWEMKVVK